MTDIWEFLKKMDCEECSVHDDCDNENLCAEWITEAKPELLKLREKAEKWDLQIDKSLSYKVSLKKLEAIRTVVEKIYNDVTPIYGFIPNKGTQEIKKILEGSQFTTKGDKDD